MSADSTTPSYFAVPGWLAVRGGAGKEGPVRLFLSSPFAAARVKVGWKDRDCCCGWLLLDLLVIPRMLCSVAVSSVMLPTVPELHRNKKTGRERSGPTPSAPHRASWPGGRGTGGAPTAAAERHSCWTAPGTYVRADLYLHIFGLRMSADSTTPSYLDVSEALAGWLGGGGERGTCGRVCGALRSCFFHPPLQLLGWRPGWKDCCCGWALAGPAGNPKNALLRRSLGRFVADCA